jgi:PAS domain S-box-containing protein
MDQDRKITELLGTDRSHPDGTVGEALPLSAQEIVNYSPQFTYVFDVRRYKFTFMNRSLQEYLGYTIEQIEDMGDEFYRILLHPDDLPRLPYMYNRWSKTEINETIHNEFRLKNSHGAWHWFLASDTLYKKDAEGNPAEIIGSIQDITKLKENEDNLRYRLDFERIISEILRTLINITPDEIDACIAESLSKICVFTKADSAHIGLFDQIGSKVGFTHSIQTHLTTNLHKELSEVSLNDMPWMFKRLQLGNTVSIPDTRELSDEAALEQALFERLDLNAVLEIPMRYKGTTIGSLGFACAAPRVWHQNEIKLLEFVGQIITDAILLKRNETQKDQMKLKMQQSQKLENLGSMASGIAHNFNNILVPIIGFTDMAMRELPKDSQILEALKEVSEAGNRASELIRQIMSFSREKATEPAPVSLEELLGQSVALLKESLPSTIDIKCSITPESELILADPKDIKQLIMNLATNAYHAMEESGGVLKFELNPYRVSTEEARMRPNFNPNQDYVCLSISDTGVGIPETYIDKIFDPFFTTKDMGKGTGLGLAEAYSIMQELNGELTVHSRAGEGTEFNMYFPSHVIVPESVLPDMAKTDNTNRGHILAVDDELAILKLQSLILESVGFTVTTVSDSQKALDAFHDDTTKFDLILLDQTMPKITGLKLAQQIRKEKPRLPIVICTGLVDEYTRMQVEKLKRCSFIRKPFDSNQFVHCVQTALKS